MAVICEPGLGDNSILATSSPVAGSMPLSYAQRMQPRDRVRFTDSADVTFTVDATAPFAAGWYSQWTALYLLFTNGGASLQWRVWAATTMAGLSSPTFDSGLMGWPSPFNPRAFPRPHLRLFLDAVRSAPFNAPRTEPCLRVTIYNAVGIFEFGRLYLADTRDYQTIAYPQPLPFFPEESRQVVAESGAIFPRGSGVRPQGELSAYLTGAEARDQFCSELQTISILRGSSRDVLYDANPFDIAHAQNGIVYGLLKDAQAPIYSFQKVYEVKMTVEGLR
jgi:hypothetical protein